MRPAVWHTCFGVENNHFHKNKPYNKGRVGAIKSNLSFVLFGAVLHFSDGESE